MSREEQRDSMLHEFHQYLNSSDRDSKWLLAEARGLDTTPYEAPFDPSMVFFTEDLTLEERQLAWHNLARHKRLLDNHPDLPIRWDRVPFLITKKEYSIRKAEGFLSFPFDFVPEELIAFLKKNLAEVSEIREALRREIDRMGTLRMDVIKLLGLEDLIIE